MAPPPGTLLHHHQRQMRILVRERHELSCERARIEFELAELKKAREEVWGWQARYGEARGHALVCNCEDTHESREWEHASTQHGGGAPESSPSQLAPGTNISLTSWSLSGSQHGNDTNSQPDFALDPLNAATDSTSSSSSSASPFSKLEQKSNASLFSGPTLVAIVVLTALPAAIVIGVFFLRKHRC